MANENESEEHRDAAQDNREVLQSLRNALTSTQMNFEVMVELDAMHAKRMHAKYTAYCEAGFNHTDAYHLIVHRGLN